MFELLKQSRIFEGLGEDELQKITKISQVAKFNKGERIFKIGDAAEHLFIVKEGEIELRFQVTYQNISHEVCLERKCRGEPLGWSALTEPYKYTLSAYAVADSELLQMGHKELIELCESDNHLGYVLMRNIARLIARRFMLTQEKLIREIQQVLKKKDSLT
jgi:CRP-like cAMP-binding protein